MAQMGKVTPNLDQQGTKTLNLTVLQRMDPSIGEILITAAHVTFYEFNIDTNQWSRKDVEGSLFVVKRNAQPRFQFIVMNRRNTENLVEDLLGDFEYEVQLPYLLYRNASQEVNGIWFYNPQECEEVAKLFTRIVNAYVKVPSKPKVPSSKNEFEELEAIPSMSVIEGPLEPSSSAPATTDGPEESAFNNFFSAALNIGSNPSNAANSRHSYHPSSTLPLTSHVSGITSPPLLTPQVSNIPLQTLPPSAAIRENLDPSLGGNRVTNLVKPSSFLAPPPSSSLLVHPVASPHPTASALYPPVTFQGPYGTPMLQPFPPPTPPPSLTPAASAITREKVRDALMMLVQDDQFVDMFHQALVKLQHS